MRTRPIVLEGIDGSGKTTLGRHLALLMEREYFHTGGPTPTFEDFINRCMEIAGLTMRTEGGAVFDRCPDISARAYQSVGPPSYAPPHFDALLGLNPVVIFCTHSPDRSPKAKAAYLKEQIGKGHKSLDYAESAWDGAGEVASRYKELELACSLLPGVDVLSYDFIEDDLVRLTDTVKGLI